MSQTKRAAYLVPMNIVEGSGRFTEKDFAYFLDQALGSAHELGYCSLLSKDLTYSDQEFCQKLINLLTK